MQYMLLFLLACFVKKGENVISPKNFVQYAGQEILIRGFAHRSKAGAFLIAEGEEIWLVNYDWSKNEYEQLVIVKGIVKRGVDPLSSFPVATQDENGAWSQGVGGFSPDLQPSSPLPKTEGWLLDVVSVELAK